MPSRNPLARLLHIRDEIDALSVVTGSLTEAEFRSSYIHRRAVEHAILIISEAARALPVALTDRYPGPRWAEIKGIGNILRHEYFAVEAATLWNILTVHLPPLATTVHKMVTDLDGVDPPP